MSELTDRLEQYQSQLKDNFLYFVSELWRMQANLKPSRIQLDLAKWIAYGPDRCGALGFRGMAKTWIINAAACWWLLRDPTEQILIICTNESYSKASLVQIRGWIQGMPFLQHLKPEKGRRDNTESFDVAGAPNDRIPSVRAQGITGALPGGRASKILVDDAEQPEAVMTRQQRERLLDRILEVEPVLLPYSPKMISMPAIRIIGTYQHIESVYDKLQRCASDRNYKPYQFRNWPIEYPTADTTTTILAPMLHKDLIEGKALPGDPVWPERFSRDYIIGLNLGKTKFQQQFMGYQDTGDSLLYPLKLADLIVHAVNPILAPTTIQWGTSTSRGSTAIETIASPGSGDDQFYGPIMVSDQWIPYAGCRAFLDPAGTGEDEMAWSIVAQLHGYLYAKASEAVTGGPTEANLLKIVNSLKEHHCHELYVEKNFGGEALIKLLEMTISANSIPADKDNKEYPNGWSAAVIPVRSTGQKEIRIIDALEPVMNHHRLVVDPTVAQNTKLMQQLVQMTKEPNCQEHDDRIESLAGAVAQFANVMGQSPEAQTKRLEEEKQQKRLEEYYKTFGLKQPSKTWSGLN